MLAVSSDVGLVTEPVIPGSPEAKAVAQDTTPCLERPSAEIVNPVAPMLGSERNRSLAEKLLARKQEGSG